MSMESSRLIFLIIFCVSLYLLGDRWVKQYAPKTDKPVAAERARDIETPVPAAASGTPPPTAVPGVPAVPAGDVGSAGGAVVTVKTDVLVVEIDTVGGEIRKTEFLRQRDTVNPEENFVLLQRGAGHTYVGQSGLLGAGLPTHKSVFTASVTKAELASGQDDLTVTLESTGTDGSVLRKTYGFKRGEYLVSLKQELSGHPGTTPPSAYFQWVRDDQTPAGESRWVPTFTGIAVYSDQDKYQKIAFSDVAKGKASHTKTASDGWVGMVQHYFVAAWLPQGEAKREFFTKDLGGGLYAAGLIVPMAAAGEGKWTLDVPFYVGPQLQETLAKLAPGLQLTVDYGWLTIIASPLFSLLSAIHEFGVSNWGLAIIIVTILIKLAFFPLSAASYKSMAKMRVLAPKLQKLKEQYGDDRQKLHQGMMELYKTEKINPLGGCLPIVVQIPVFIALYWVLLGSVEMRNAPFILWIKDLASPDPFFVLPVLMGISMIIQSRLNPEPPDPIQAKVMKIMPVAFSVFFFFFPAGLVLYWLVNNILSIAQQWVITRKLEQASSSAAPKR